MGIRMRILIKLRPITVDFKFHESTAKHKAVELIAEDAGNLNSKLVFMNLMLELQGDKALGMPCLSLKTEEA